MALRINDAAFRRDAIGMPASHAESFKAIAKREDVVILSRAPGPTCRQLLEHGYDTKGFRVHAKSCDWGPMAGFVMRDPRLNKKGLANEAFNRKEHAEALEDKNHAGWQASVTPLKIYPEQLLWLQQKGLIRLEPVKGNTHFFDGVATHTTAIHFNYIVVSKQEQGQNVWGIYVNNSALVRFTQEVGALPRSYYMPAVFGTRYEALLAMTNPLGHASWPRGDFRNAITGDYDPFLVWPTNRDYDPNGRGLPQHPTPLPRSCTSDKASPGR